MFGMALGRMGRNGGVRAGAVVRALFANGEQGAWYDPSDFSTMSQDTAGVTPVTATGQPVGRILDKSGRGVHVIQGTAAARPVLQQDAQGFYYLAFDGVDDFLGSSDASMAITGALSIAIGVYKNNASRFDMFVTDQTTNAIGSYEHRSSNAAANIPQNLVYGSGAAEAAASSANALITPAAKQVLAVTRGASVVSFYKNAGLADTFTQVATPAAGATPLFRLGTRAGADLFLLGRLYQVIVVSRVFSTTERASINAYVNTKTGAY